MIDESGNGLVTKYPLNLIALIGFSGLVFSVSMAAYGYFWADQIQTQLQFNQIASGMNPVRLIADKYAVISFLIIVIILSRRLKDFPVLQLVSALGVTVLIFLASASIAMNSIEVPEYGPGNLALSFIFRIGSVFIALLAVVQLGLIFALHFLIREKDIR
ncbi:MAG: hypothetical protein KF762_17300 [Acidobacteria bacterium]|nr:hypothetical protein [Acidobacteriota bacterium]